jgi:hypothetical protein
MIKIENVEVYGWEAAIRGMRNPLNSWKLSDSVQGQDGFVIGKNDYGLMERLVSAGSDHGKFMRFIGVTVDITAPLYWWKEFDTYKVGTVANSCSTMHKIHAKEFTLEDFSHEHLYDIDPLKRIIKHLNNERLFYLDEKNKAHWWQMIQLLPSSYNQKRTVLLNYEVLRHMYHARKNHKLDEWRDLCAWIKTLPYHGLITMGEQDEE